jgi:hypothetical protein
MEGIASLGSARSHDDIFAFGDRIGPRFSTELSTFPLRSETNSVPLSLTFFSVPPCLCASVRTFS